MSAEYLAASGIDGEPGYASIHFILAKDTYRPEPNNEGHLPCGSTYC